MLLALMLKKADCAQHHGGIMGLTLPAGLPQAPVRGQPGVEYRIRCVDVTNC